MPIDDDLVDEIAGRIRAQKCILFLGAGVHSAPPDQSPFKYPDAHRPLSGGELARRLASATNFGQTFPNDSVSNLQRVSMHFELENTRRKLLDELTLAISTNKRPSIALKALARMPFPLVITTNYDSLFETAASLADRKPRVIAYQKAENARASNLALEQDSSLLLKLHGDIGDRENIVITDEDYIQFILRMGDRNSPVPLVFQYHLVEWPTLFIGYSLIDYNLRLLLRTLWSRLDKSVLPSPYAVDPYPDRLIKLVWGRPGGNVIFISEGVWDFVPKLVQRLTGTSLDPNGL